MPKLYRLADVFQRWRAKRRPRSGAPRGLLLVSSGGLGDTILFSHVIERFCDYAKAGEVVTVLLRRDGAKTAFLFPEGVRAFVVDYQKFRDDLAYRLAVSDQLYDAHYRAVVTTDYLRHPDLDEVLVMAAQAAETVAMVVRPWRKYQKQLARNTRHFTRLFESGPELQDKILRWYRFADWLTGTPSVPALRLIDAANFGKAEPPLVLMQPFSAVRAKQPAPAVYAALIEALPDDADVRITGGPGDLERNPDFKPLLDRANVTFEGAGFEDLVPLLQAARLVVSVDTAVMHLSVAAGAPTLCLASAAYVGEIVPYAPDLTPMQVDFYYKSMDCEGCLGRCIKSFQDGAYPCVAQLQTDHIVTRALQLFAGSAR